MLHIYCIPDILLIVCIYIAYSLYVGPARPRHGVAIPGRIRMSLPAMKSVHEPVAVGLAGMVQEYGSGRNMQRICSYLEKNMQRYRLT